jgi:hypothetical protein
MHMQKSIRRQQRIAIKGSDGVGVRLKTGERADRKMGKVQGWGVG